MDIPRPPLKKLLSFYESNKSAVLWFSAGILLFVALQFGSELLGLLLAPFTLLFRAQRVAKAAEVLGVLDSLKEEQDEFEEEIKGAETDLDETRVAAEKEADKWLDR